MATVATFSIAKYQRGIGPFSREDENNFRKKLRHLAGNSTRVEYTRDPVDMGAKHDHAHAPQVTCRVTFQQDNIDVHHILKSAIDRFPSLRNVTVDDVVIE